LTIFYDRMPTAHSVWSPSAACWYQNIFPVLINYPPSPSFSPSRRRLFVVDDPNRLPYVGMLSTVSGFFAPYQRYDSPSTWLTSLSRLFWTVALASPFRKVFLVVSSFFEISFHLFIFCNPFGTSRPLWQTFFSSLRFDIVHWFSETLNNSNSS